MVTAKFSIGVDILTVIAETKPEGCVDFDVMTAIDDFSWQMSNIEGVQSTIDLAGVARQLNVGLERGQSEVAGAGAQPFGADPVGDLRSDDAPACSIPTAA